MKNEFSIGPFTIYGYGLMIGIGIAAYRLRRAGQLKLDPGIRYSGWLSV